MFSIKQNLILSHVKVYLAVRTGMVASSVTGDLGSCCLVALPSSTLWPTSSPGGYVLVSRRMREEAGPLLLPFKGTTQELHRSLPFVSHWPGFNHMATLTYKGNWDCVFALSD